MKFIIGIAFLCIQWSCLAQTAVLDSTAFDVNFKLSNGIYTSLLELQYSAPKYPDCELDLENQRSTLSFSSLYYITAKKVRKPYDDQLFATVVDGRLFIFHHNHLNPIFLRGAICTFILKEYIATTYYPSGSGNPYPYGSSSSSYPSTQHVEVTNIYFFDFKTGIIETVEKERLDFVIQRDSVLYKTFSKIYTDPNNKKTYSYISQYNLRNPVYIYFFREETIHPEE